MPEPNAAVRADHQPSVAFVFCVEPGRLEPEARLLVESIRHFGGCFANATLYAVQPRNVDALRPETMTAFGRANVIHRAAQLNMEYAPWPTTNKVYAVADVENVATTEYLVFLDTDSVIMNEPREFLLQDGVDLAVQPTLKQFRGSRGPGDPNDPFWLKIYRMCEVPEPPYVHTMLDRVRIRGYYNGGLVVFRRAAGLGRRWLAFLQRIGPTIPGEIRYNLDQFALAAVAASVPERVYLLPSVYNYNIARRDHFVLDAVRHASLDSLIHIHYHDAFRQPDFLGVVRPPLDQTDERYRWLAQRLPLPNVELLGDRAGLPWAERLALARDELAATIPPGATVIVADEDQWGLGKDLSGRPLVPFTERDGQYWGPPADDAAALQEVERLRQAGAGFLAFGWPAFWWLRYYLELHRDLRTRYQCVFENDRLIVFDLRHRRPGPP